MGTINGVQLQAVFETAAVNCVSLPVPLSLWFMESRGTREQHYSRNEQSNSDNVCFHMPVEIKGKKQALVHLSAVKQEHFHCFISDVLDAMTKVCETWALAACIWVRFLIQPVSWTKKKMDSISPSTHSRCMGESFCWAIVFWQWREIDQWCNWAVKICQGLTSVQP